MEKEDQTGTTPRTENDNVVDFESPDNSQAIAKELGTTGSVESVLAQSIAEESVDEIRSKKEKDEQCSIM